MPATDTTPPPTKQGNWIPLSKLLVKFLPADRPYTPLEAMYSLTCDYDNNNTATVSGYAALWCWSRGRVERFLWDAGLFIEYESTTSTQRNKRGHLVTIKRANSEQITDIKRANNEQINFIDSRWLQSASDIKRTNNGHKTSKRQITTTYPDPYPEPLPIYIPAKEWDAFLQMRKQKGKPPTDHARQLLLDKLGKMHSKGVDIADVLNRSTINGWLDVFEPKQPRQTAKPEGKPSYGTDPGTKQFLARA